MNDKPTPDEIRRNMSRIRGNLGGEVAGIAENARQLLNWRHYVQASPWVSLGIASVLGYFVVPRRLEIVSPDANTLEQLAKDNRLVVEHRPRDQNKPSTVSSLANLAGNMLLRAGIAYVGQNIGKIFGEQTIEASNNGRSSS